MGNKQSNTLIEQEEFCIELPFSIAQAFAKQLDIMFKQVHEEFFLGESIYKTVTGRLPQNSSK